MTGLTVSGLGFAREDEWIFRNLSFEVGNGHCLLIEGSNGSGKTTLLKVLAGLLEAQEGTLECVPHASNGSSRLAYMGHQMGLKDDLTSIENLRFIIELSGLPDVSLDTTLAAVGLDGYQDAPARRLSAGQRKRLALARLVHDTGSLWLLDEPYANLDTEGAGMLSGLIRTHLNGDGVALITSHGNISPELPGLSAFRLNA